MWLYYIPGPVLSMISFTLQSNSDVGIITDSFKNETAGSEIIGNLQGLHNWLSVGSS